MTQSAFNMAMALLARREHARAELFQKLENKGYTLEEITAALGALEAKDYLNESRFIGCRVRFRAGCGMGPLKILSEFQYKYQIDKKDVMAHEAWQGLEWEVLASNVRDSKYGPHLPKTSKEKAVQWRFLQQRGFTVEHIQKVLKK